MACLLLLYLPSSFLYIPRNRTEYGWIQFFLLSLSPLLFAFFSFRTLQAKGKRKKVFTSLSLSLSLWRRSNRGSTEGGRGETSIKAEKVEEEKEDIEKRRRRKTVASEQRGGGKQFSASPQSHPVFRKLRLVSSPPPLSFVAAVAAGPRFDDS